MKAVLFFSLKQLIVRGLCVQWFLIFKVKDSLNDVSNIASYFGSKASNGIVIVP